MCLEEGSKKGHIHIQGAWAMKLPVDDNLEAVIRQFLRIVCNFARGAKKPWNVVVRVHPEDPRHQKSLSKVTRNGIFGYCSKQRHTCPSYKYAPHVTTGSLVVLVL